VQSLVPKAFLERLRLFEVISDQATAAFLLVLLLPA
jgi:hypothetical protein